MIAQVDGYYLTLIGGSTEKKQSCFQSLNFKTVQMFGEELTTDFLFHENS